MRAAQRLCSMGRPKLLGVSLLWGLFCLAAGTPARAAEDDRAYQHGIDFVRRPDGKWWLIWSSSGNPPTGPDGSGNWTDDIYAALVDPASPSVNPNAAVAFIKNPEAQEPAASAISADGHIMVTMEDGWNTSNEVAQRYGVYDAELKASKAYPQMIQDGGHSGHITAVDNRFVVVYADDWITDGTGVCGLGEGLDVKTAIFDSSGKMQGSVIDVAAGSPRDWWPYVAGSKTRAVYLWQRFVPGKTVADLYAAVLDPATGSVVKPAFQLDGNIEYYHYSIEYIAAVDRFLVRGTYHEDPPSGSACDVVTTTRGFGHLLDGEGNVTGSNKALDAVVRESQSIVRNDAASAVVVQPKLPNGASVLRVTATEITPLPDVADDYHWDYGGTDGIFVSERRVFVASLSTKGMVTKTFEIDAPVDGAGGGPPLGTGGGAGTAGAGDGGSNGAAAAPGSGGGPETAGAGGTTGSGGSFEGSGGASVGGNGPMGAGAASSTGGAGASGTTRASGAADAAGCACEWGAGRPSVGAGLAAFLLAARAWRGRRASRRGRASQGAVS
jgi:hypothetical protein